MSLELKNRIITSIFLLLLLILMFHYNFILIVSLIIIAVISWIEFYNLVSKVFKKNIIKEKVFRFLGKSISLLYLSLFIFLILINIEQKFYIFYLLLISIFSDLGGLIVGKIFKGRKLTKISPNKTISGSIGSFIFSLLLIPIFYFEFSNSNIYIILIFTIFISMISQLGDLFISLIKRKAKVKHTSDILPGHGGFLDRIDGILFAVPIGILFLKVLSII
jgi:phosphatidate cytidylyltransferase